jgi:hypothetical protein
MQISKVWTRRLSLSVYEEGKVPEQRRSKLMSQWDGHFYIIEMVNHIIYKVDLASKYGVNDTFNVFFISLYLM